MSGAPGPGVVIIMITFTERADPDPEIILALIGSFKGPITELLHVADGVDRPGAVIGDQDRDIETPKKAAKPEKNKKRKCDEQVWDHIETGSFPQTAVPDFADIGRVA